MAWPKWLSRLLSPDDEGSRGAAPGPGAGGWSLDRQYLAGEVELPVSSSWVRSLRYRPELHALEVRFIHGGGRRVWPVSPQEALEALNAGSKGGWLWDNVWQRGRGLGRRRMRNVSPL